MATQSTRGNITCGTTYVTPQAYELGDAISFSCYGSLSMNRNGPGNKNDVLSEDYDSDSDHNKDSGHPKKIRVFGGN